ncbi:hypothetical protein L3Q82_023415 [Scortum barcoo]|uniref:Uncharacterized protein n=1 Tax=Scortum barcoo TaxID=214431 RepID=A0ACB8WZN7_9TELE|nr:hypothetical protein L3Q82_023415 [Scortum barcoo]
MGSEEKETSLYLIQIQHLDKQLESSFNHIQDDKNSLRQFLLSDFHLKSCFYIDHGQFSCLSCRFQLKCDELEKQNKRLSSHYVELEKDKADISEYLKHSAADKERKLEELARRLEGQQEDARREADDLKLKHHQQIQELQDGVDEMKKENEMRAVGLEEQQEELVLMRQQLSQKEHLKKLLVSQREENEAAIKRLEEETLKRMELSEKMKKATNGRIKAETSAIVQEERAQHGELLEKIRILLDQNEDLWRKNDAVENNEWDICLDIDELKRQKSKLTKKKLAQEEKVQQLRWKWQELESELEICGINVQHLQAKREDLSRTLDSVSEQRRLNSARVAQLEAELQEEASRRRRLEADVQEAIGLLGHILMDSSKASRTQWERLMDVLEDAEDLTESSRPGRTPETAEPEADRADTLKLTSDLTFLMARYRPGDLGLVPRPTWKHKAARTGDRPANSFIDISVIELTLIFLH